MSSVVRIKKGSWLQGASTRLQQAQLDPLQQQQQQQHFRQPEYRIGDAASRDYITIRYSKRDIGRQLQDVDVRTASQEYGGLHLVADGQGFMAFQLDGVRVAHACSVTPLDVFEHFILQHIFKLADAKNKYTLMHLVLTVPVSATEDVKDQYEAAAKRALQKFPGLLPEGGALPEVHIVAEPVAGMCDHFTTADDEDDDDDEGAQQQQQQQQERVYLGIDVGDGTTDCCLVKYKPSAGASGAASVVGAHGNSYLGAVDAKHAVLSMLPEEVLGRVPEQCTEQLMRAVDKASEELSNSGAVDEVWCDWEGVTDAVESRQWLQENIVITRGMVHAAAAGFADAFKQAGQTWLARHSILTTLAVAQLPATAVTHVVAMGGGSELPCVQQAIRVVFGNAVSITKGQGGGSTQIANGAATYVLQLLEQRRQQKGQQPAQDQQQLQLGPVSMPVGMHICTKVTFRGYCLHPKDQHTDYPISVGYLQQLKRCLTTTDASERTAQQQMLDAVAAHYAHLEDPSKPQAKMPPKKQLTNLQVLLPLIDCRTATPTAPTAITFMPCSKQHRSYSISLYAADPLLTTFTYIGGREVQASAVLSAAAGRGGGKQQKALHVMGEVWVDDRQRVQCRARLQSGQELPVTAVFDRDAVQRGRRQDRLSKLSSAAVLLLRQLNFGGVSASQVKQEAAARRQQELEAAAVAAAIAAAQAQQAGAAAAVMAANAAAAATTEAATAAAAKQQQEAPTAAAAKQQQEAEKAAAARQQQLQEAEQAAAARRQQQEAETAAAARQQQQKEDTAAAARRQQQEAEKAAAAKQQQEAERVVAARWQQQAEKAAAAKQQQEAETAAAARHQQQAEKAAAARRQQEAAFAALVKKQQEAAKAAASAKRQHGAEAAAAAAAAAALASLASTPPGATPASSAGTSAGAAGFGGGAPAAPARDLIDQLQQVLGQRMSTSSAAARPAAAAVAGPVLAAVARAGPGVANTGPAGRLLAPSTRLPGLSGRQSSVLTPPQLPQQHNKRKQPAPQHLPPGKRQQQVQLPPAAHSLPVPQQQQPPPHSRGLPQLQQLQQQARHVRWLPQEQEQQQEQQPQQKARLGRDKWQPFSNMQGTVLQPKAQGAADARLRMGGLSDTGCSVGVLGSTEAITTASKAAPTAVVRKTAPAGGMAPNILGSRMQNASTPAGTELVGSAAAPKPAAAPARTAGSRKKPPAITSVSAVPVSVPATGITAAAGPAAMRAGTGRKRGRPRKCQQSEAAAAPVEVINIADSSDDEDGAPPPGGSCRPHTGGSAATTSEAAAKRSAAAPQHDAAGGAAVLVGVKRAAAAAAAPPAGGRVLEAVGCGAGAVGPVSTQGRDRAAAAVK
uniref:Uncharacterized protein n=1 Tax=Tetradesmus obliquus TaxID=3088 RepID=A0A383WL79_TETOB|eukprot:jgi/Sobl393_1/18322/SZX77919.1